MSRRANLCTALKQKRFSMCNVILSEQVAISVLQLNIITISRRHSSQRSTSNSSCVFNMAARCSQNRPSIALKIWSRSTARNIRSKCGKIRSSWCTTFLRVQRQICEFKVESARCISNKYSHAFSKTTDPGIWAVVRALTPTNPDGTWRIE